MLILEIIAIASSASTVTAALVQFVRKARSNEYSAKFSRIYELNGHERGLFNEIVLPTRFPVAGHTHGESAASRSAASSAAAAYALATSREPFYVSMSASDQRAGRAGNRKMYWSKDFNAEPRNDKPTKNSVLVMIDVDEHIDDLPKVLHDNYLPTILYTFQPSQASGVFQDYRYTFNAKGEVVYDVAGGGKYVHQVWDYSPDCVTMRKKFLGLTYAKSLFTVEKRYVDVNHQLISLTPLARFGLLGCIFSCCLQGDDLQRLNPIQGDFIRFKVSRSKTAATPYQHLTTTSCVGMYNAATVPVEVDDAIALTAKNAESVLSPFQVKSLYKDLDAVSASTLVDYHRKMKGVTVPVPRVVVPTDAVNNYTFNPSPFMDEKPSVKPFMAPILPDCYAPTCTVENDAAMIKGRIIDVKPKNSGQSLSEKYLGYAVEFAAMVAKEVGSLIPVGHEEIVAKLNRPSQQRITEEASWWGAADPLVKSFMKKEAYQKPSDPRPIATINGKDKYEYSSFTYAAAEAIKKCSWYAFGRKPSGISRRVAQICMAALKVVLTDLSRFDGRVTTSMRQFEQIFMKALFEPKYWKELLECMRKQHGQRGVTSKGIAYQNGDNRASGSPETALLNSSSNAFMAYVTLREQGLSPDEAYAKLGIYGGDDGMTPDVNEKLYIAVCATFGHVLEAETIHRGEKGVNMLARIYSPDVWYGSQNSCADIARALSKIHVTPAVNAPAVDKLFEKCYALFLTDANTPIIGDFVSRVVEVSGKSRSDYRNILGIWNSQLEADEQYPNENHDNWMYQVVVDQKLCGFDLFSFTKWLSSCTTMQQFLSCPLFINQPDLKLPSVVVKINGDLYVPDEDDLAPVFWHVDPIKPKKRERKRKAAGTPASINPSQHSQSKPYASSGTTGNNLRTMGKPPTRHNNTMVHGKPGGLRSDVPVSGDRFPSHLVGQQRSDGDRRGIGSMAGKPIDHSGQHSIEHGADGISPAPTNNTNSDSGLGLGLSLRPPIRTGPRHGFVEDKCEAGGIIDFVPSPLLVGVELNPGPSSEELAQQMADDGYVAVAFDKFIHAAAPYAGAMIDKVPKRVEDDIAHWANHGSNFGIVDKVVSMMEPITKHFGNPQHPQQINGNNGSATNTDDHAAKLVKEEKKTLQKLKKEVNHITQHQQQQQKHNAAPKPRQKADMTKTMGMTAAATSYANGLTIGKPRVVKQNPDSTTLEHTELLGGVNGSAAWTVGLALAMQPGLASTFTWLSTQCSGWEKYMWEYLEIIYLTRCSTATTGSVYIMPDYDAADASPGDEKSGSSFYGTATDSPWKTITCKFDMKRSRELFLRNGPLPQNLDIKTYDFANMMVGTVDGAVAPWGKVYARYRVRLINPQAVVPNLVGGLLQSSGGGVTVANPFGNSPVYGPGSFVGYPTGLVIPLSNLIIGQEYQMIFQIAGTGITAYTSSHSGLTFKNTFGEVINAAGSNMVTCRTYVATASSSTYTSTITATTVVGATYTFTLLTNVTGV